ncbi:MAG: DUF4440 domain-containing protein [Bacteroidetes bacterium]|nr:DUF4440 domain-containing protein [Bacteroidota bacterium]
MKKITSYYLIVSVVSSFLLMNSCNSATSSTAKSDDTTTQMITHPDMQKVKTEIQEIATKWANAENARDAKTVSDFYADDAIRMPNNLPMISGKANIVKSLEDEMASTPKGAMVSIESLGVFGNELDVIDYGKTILKDSNGKVLSTGKYLTYWQKRNGKYLAIRDMINDDAKSN